MHQIGERAGVTVTKVPKIRCDRRGGLRGVGECYGERRSASNWTRAKVGNGCHRADVGRTPRRESVEVFRPRRAGIQTTGCPQPHLVHAQRVIVDARHRLLQHAVDPQADVAIVGSRRRLRYATQSGQDLGKLRFQ